MCPATFVGAAVEPFGFTRNPERSSLAFEIVIDPASFSRTLDGHDRSNVGAVLSILITSVFAASMFPLTSTDRASISVLPSALIVNGPLYFVHGASAAPSSL